ncbi:hypothetical protein B0F90DRAFT_1784429 [Multifurca ochricompacta]|uniref:Crinkler effector protein N-terminal domain-containing protein n=1 Tax=Multifurca ochricompacta TaxID=376703 RepID=A0AAD4QIY3_9AGAM|nr:hypothetical protein B0F90DRAFT_1784429 [Multifurca ochricompacta]
MATTLTLFCLAIDNQKDPIGNVFKVEVQSGGHVSDINDAIKVKKAPELDHLAADRLIVWTLSTLQRTNLPSSTISAAIEFPSDQNNRVGNVELLYPTTRLSRHWDHSPDDDYLHLIVQVPLVESPEKGQNVKLSDKVIEDIYETAMRLHKTLWKKPLGQIFPTINAPDLKKTYTYVPQVQLSNFQVENFGYDEKTLLFRDEYSIAFEEIKGKSRTRRKNNIGGIVITGHPGLGKTCFLLYLLFYCLSDGRPTALQIVPECFVLFTDSGPEVYSHVSIKLPDETLALADSNAENPLPCHSFLRASKKHDAFIVQTSSPDQRRYKAWSKEYHAPIYVMDCFTLTELVVLGMIHGFSVPLIKDHCKKWGPSARIMVNLMTNPEEICEHTDRVKDAALHFAKHFDEFTRLDKVRAMSISHTLFTIHPKGLPSEERSSAIG